MKTVIRKSRADDEMFEMANIVQADSGLKERIWISVNTAQRHNRPRLKVEGTDKKLYLISLDEPIEFLAGWPQNLPAAEFRRIQEFIVLNREVLLAHWNDELSSKETLNQIRKV